MSELVYDQLAQALREFAGRFGETAFTDRRRLTSLLSDRMPEARREIRVISSAIDERVFETLARTRPEQIGMEMDRLAARLENAVGIRTDIALSTVRACAYGLGLAPLPSTMPNPLAGPMPGAAPPAGRTPPPPPPPPMPSQEGSWVGVSQPVANPPVYPAPGYPAPGQSAPGYGSPNHAAPNSAAGANQSRAPASAAMPPPFRPPPPQQPAYQPPSFQQTLAPPPASGFTWTQPKVLVGGGLAMLVVLVGLYALGRDRPDPVPAPVPPRPPEVVPAAPRPPVTPTTTTPAPPVRPSTGTPGTGTPGTGTPSTGNPTPPAQPRPAAIPQVPARAYGEEATSFGVEPQEVVQDNLGSPTPTSIPNGRTVTTVELADEMRKGTTFLLVDALADAHAQTIIHAIPIPYAGAAGNLYDDNEENLANTLNRLTGGNKDYPIVFFCQGVRCWESYNAALRAMAAQYRNVLWYRGGLNAWREAGLPMQPYR